ncbi:MAG: PnuC protein, partial [Bacteroidota bacterium]
MESIIAYYGLDWLGMGLSLLAVYQLGNKNKFGFINFIIANLIWVFLGIFMMDSIGLTIGNIVFLIM